MIKTDDIISDENEIKIPYASWDKVGKSYKGVYVLREVVPNSLKVGEQQVNYTLAEATERVDEKSEAKPVEGSILKVSGRGSRNPAVLPQLELCKLGQVVAIKYVEQRKPNKPGHDGAKIIRVYTKGEMKPEVLAEFNGEEEVSDIDADEILEKM